MTRLRRLVISGSVFFITTNVRRRLPPLTPGERDLLCESIVAVRERRKFRLPGFVVMPDHLHLLVLPAPTDTISALVQELKYVTGRAVNSQRKIRGTLWQKGFFDRFMRTPKEFFETLDYLHQNPVRKGLATVPEEWQWSSAAAYAGLPSIIAVDLIDLPAESERGLG